MVLGSGTQAAVVARAMMEEGLWMGSMNGHGQGKLWSLDQNMDKPLGLEANRMHNMQYRKLRNSNKVEQNEQWSNGAGEWHASDSSSRRDDGGSFF
ncbi:unnamed protein product [Sphagnum balticum]